MAEVLQLLMEMFPPEDDRSEEKRTCLHAVEGQVYAKNTQWQGKPMEEDVLAKALGCDKW